jgi:antitoxin component of MazEF toxin-antitoxin module
MSILTLQLSNEPVVTLPADLAQRAGLQEGTALEATVSAEGLELRPAGQETAAYAAGWPARQAQLRERAIALGLYQPDRRDDEYWQIVTPLLQELDHELPSYFSISFAHSTRT